MRRFGADIVGGTVILGGLGVLAGCAPADTPAAAQKITGGQHASGVVTLPAGDLVPNAGDVSPQLRLALPSTPSQLVPADLDQEGTEELLLRFEDGWQVAALTDDGASLTLDPVVGALEDTLAAVGAGAVIGIGETSHLARLTHTSAGWEVSAEPVAAPVQWAMALGDHDADGEVALVVDGKLQVRAGPLDPALPDAAIRDEIIDWPGVDVPAPDCRMVDASIGTSWRSVYLRTAGPGDTTEVILLPGDADDPVRASLADHGYRTGVLDLAAGCDLDAHERAVPTAEGVWTYPSIYNDAPDGPTLTYAWPGATEIEEEAGVWAIRGEEMAWWYGAPDFAQVRPDAAAAMPGAVLATLGRFGSTARLDVAWADTDTLYVIPAFGGLVGTDVDRDGFTPPEDCDDTDALTVPGASDPWDGLDNDCDGVVDEADDGLLVRILGEGYDARIGGSVVGVPHDGGDQLAWIEDGTLFVQSFTVNERWDVDLPEAGDRVDLAGDVDGDGEADLAIGGQWDQGFLFTTQLAYGPAESAEFADLDKWFRSAGSFAAGDLDEDGWDDLVNWGAELYVYSTGWIVYYNYYAQASVGFGGPEHERTIPSMRPFPTLDDASLTLGGPADLDGDGHFDLGRLSSDTLIVYPGPYVPPENLFERTDTLRISGMTSTGTLAVAVDGGTPDDLVIVDRKQGVVHIALGPFPRVPLELADLPAATFTGPFTSTSTASVAVGDGWIFIGAPEEEDGAGVVYAFPLDPLQDIDAADATYRWTGPCPDAAFGERLGLADLDADGALELIVGATGDLRAYDSGAIYVYRIPH